jgi:hypothetical protein
MVKERGDGVKRLSDEEVTFSVGRTATLHRRRMLLMMKRKLARTSPSESDPTCMAPSPQSQISYLPHLIMSAVVFPSFVVTPAKSTRNQALPRLD